MTVEEVPRKEQQTMKRNGATPGIGRRPALQAGMAALGATLASQAGTQSAAPQKSRLRDYAWVTGFNYQPSWGSHGITIWNDFRPAVFARGGSWVETLP